METAVLKERGDGVQSSHGINHMFGKKKNFFFFLKSWLRERVHMQRKFQDIPARKLPANK